MVGDAGQGYAKIYKMEEKRKIDEVVYEVSRFWFMCLIYLVINLFIINLLVANERFYMKL